MSGFLILLQPNNLAGLGQEGRSARGELPAGKRHSICGAEVLTKVLYTEWIDISPSLLYIRSKIAV